jgi:cytosine/adenosine deaminase-related metal-dependent hydrolase
VGRGVAVHLNYTEPAHLDALAERGITVVFCPRASRFLGHPEAGAPVHAWRSMLAHGIPVALGTDGRPCLRGPGLRGSRLSVLDDGVELQSTAGARLEEWLPMATIHGARAIGLHPAEVTLVPGPKTGILSIPLGRSDVVDIDPEGPVEWLVRDLERVPEWSSGG